jgi:hypothetical protein
VPAHEKVVGQFYRRLAGWCAVRKAVAAVTLFAFAWGTAVLVLRVALGTPAEPLLWAAVGVPVAAGVAVWLALRRLPDRAAVRALLDHRGDCGGLLMAGAERDLGRWEPAVGGLPRLRWRAGRPLGLLAAAVGYVALGFLLPTREIAADAGALDVNRETDRLGKQVKVLHEEKVIDRDRAETLEKKLAEVKTQAGAKDPAKTLEALDHVNEVLKQEARKAAEAAARKADKLDQLGAAAEAIQAAAPSLDPVAAAALMAELSAMAAKAAAEGDLGDLDPELAAACKAGKLSPEQLAKLAAAAKDGARKGQKLAKALYDARLIDADQLKACEGKCDGKGLCEFLKKNGAKCPLSEALAKVGGRGGVNDDGPQGTELTFGEKSSEDGAKFKEEALPPADRDALKDSQSAGVKSTAPKVEKGTGRPAAGSLAGAAAGGGSATAAEVLPQHKAAVGRYFDRK